MKKATAALLGILLLAGCSDGVTQEQGMKNQTCKNLAKIKGIDDLLFQMYSNLDSYCLFEMPAGELERIWGIPVVDFTDPKDEGRVSVVDKEDTLYIIKMNADYEHQKPNKIVLEVQMGDAYIEKITPFWGGSIAQGQLPALLPKPIVITPISDPNAPAPIFDFGFGLRFKEPENIYESSSYYIWLNKSERPEKFPALVIETSSYAGSMPVSIELRQQSGYPKDFEK